MSKPTMEIEIFTQQPEKNYVGKVFSNYGSRSTAIYGLACNYHGITFTAHLWARTVTDKNTQQESVVIEANPPKDVKFESPELLTEFQKIALATARVNLGYNAAQHKALLRLSTEAKAETAETSSRETLNLTAFKAAIAAGEAAKPELTPVSAPTAEITASPVTAAGPLSGIAPEPEPEA